MSPNPISPRSDRGSGRGSDRASDGRPSRFAGFTDRPIFIGGCPRSGTTLFRTMLNAHPDLAVPREMRYLTDAWIKRKKWTDLSQPEARERLVRWIVDRDDSRYVSKTNVDAEHARAELLQQTTLGSVLGRSLELYAERTGKPRWADKRPLYILYVPEILTLFPDAQFIEIVRDPRGAVSSMKELGWFEGEVAGGVELWRRSIESALVAERHLAPDQFLRVRYETLLDDPRGVLTHVAEFAHLDLAGVSNMVDYPGHQAEAEKMRQRYHSNVSKGVDPTIAESWRRRLDDEEIAFIEKMAAPYMPMYDYRPVSTKRVLPNRRQWALRRKYKMRQVKVRRRLPPVDRWDAEPSPLLSARLTAGQRSLWTDGSTS